MQVKKFFQLLFKYFLQGLLLLAPITATIFIIYKSFQYVDGLLPFQFPGLGLATVLVGITIIGFLGSTILAKPLKILADEIIGNTPGIKIIYSAIKDFMEALVGKKKKFTEPVLVKIYEGTGLLKLGFITGRDLSVLGLSNGYVAVYFPHSYNFSGNLFFVPVKNITPVQGSSSEIMKYVVTAGVTSLPDSQTNQEEVIA
ncbi:MAG: DUF502 domain-containing protein [Bacteroidales bacterium]